MAGFKDDECVDAGLTLFVDPDFIVRSVPAESEACVVTFHSLTDDPRLHRLGFAEAFLSDGGIAAIHVINRTNTWYNYARMPVALATIRDAVAPFRRVLTYGSSMGGYAAIRFADAVGADTAMAISPQYSVTADVTRFETRWRSIVPRAGSVSERRAHGSKAVRPIVFFDPLSLDRRHAELIAQHYPRTRLVRLPYGGHPVGAYLADLSLLKPAVAAMVADHFDPGAFERDARAGRARSPHYLFTLARRLPDRRHACKVALMEQALLLGDDAAHRIYLSLLLEADGRLADARAHLAAAALVLPDHPVPIRACCCFALRRDDHAAARPLAERLVTISGDSAPFRQLLSAARASRTLPGWLARRRVRRAISVHRELRQWDEYDLRRPGQSVGRALRELARRLWGGV